MYIDRPIIGTLGAGVELIGRRAEGRITALLAELPAVMVVGPRASGKTTTASALAGSVVRLDRPGEADAVRADPDAALRGHAEPVLIDEWQEVPEVLGAVKRAVDGDSRPGRFLLTGSARGVGGGRTWPGTGRLVTVRMDTVSVAELRGLASAPTFLDHLLTTGEPPAAGEHLDLRDYVEIALRSGFPEIVRRDLQDEARHAWLESYVDQIVGRDAPAVESRDPTRLRRYLQALALNTAGVPQEQTLAGAAGIDRRTAGAYDALLQDLFIVESLPAWRTNRLKRLVGTPKRLLVDSGLLTGVLGIDASAVLRDAGLLGRLIETFTAGQLRSDVGYSRRGGHMSHLREAGGAREVDLLIEARSGALVAVEVKATSAPTASDARHLVWLRERLGEQLEACVLFHTGPRAYRIAPGVWAAPISALWGST